MLIDWNQNNSRVSPELHRNYQGRKWKIRTAEMRKHKQCLRHVPKPLEAQEAWGLINNSTIFNGNGTPNQVSCIVITVVYTDRNILAINSWLDLYHQQNGKQKQSNFNCLVDHHDQIYL